VTGHRFQWEDGSSRLARASLQIRPGFHRETVEHKGHTEALGDRGRRLGLGSGCLADAVVDVVGDRFETGLASEIDERGRVGAT